MSFRNNIEDIATKLIAAYGLKFNKEVAQLSNPLFRWLDFRLRYIDPIPREVIYSCALPKILPKEVQRGLNVLKRLIREGKDINPYQSRYLIDFNDSSGLKKAKRTDLLWADWGISHLHITDEPLQEGSYFSRRDTSNGECWLLFCMFFENEVGFLDIRKHDEEHLFSDIELIRIIKQSWPNYMSQFKLNVILPARNGRNNHEIGVLRKAGIYSPIVLDDGIYMGFGMGVTTASTPVKVVRMADDVLNWVKSLESFAYDPAGQLQTETKGMGIEEPSFEFCLTPKGVALLETTSNMAFTFPKRADSHFSKMENLFLPNWALKGLLSKYPPLE